MDKRIEKFCISPEADLRQVFSAIQSGNKQIALVVDGDCRLLGLVTDGDARRAILAGKDLTEPASAVMNPQFISGRVGMSGEEMAAIFRTTRAGHLPLLDESGRVRELVWYKDFQVGHAPLDVIAVVMAGGLGSRLMPLTQDTPKPLLHVGARPILEDILERLGRLGLQEVYLTTCHMKAQFVEHFRNKAPGGMDIRFLEETRPLGTAGGLSLLADPGRTLLVINGDILTRVDFSAMLAFHREQKADLTVAMRRFEMQVPFGVLETEDIHLVRLVEKPVYTLNVNAGIYLIEPGVHALLPQNESFQMTDLITRTMELGKKVLGFPVVEYWLDIGTKCDYARAQADMLLNDFGDVTCQQNR